MRNSGYLTFIFLLVVFSCTEDADPSLVLHNETDLTEMEASRARVRAEDGLAITTQSEGIILSVELFTEGVITVDWGDGSSETIVPEGSEASFWFVREHDYTKAKPHTITLSGDVDKIISITPDLPPGVSLKKAVNFSGLENLPVLWNLTTSSAINFGKLDFSENMFLRSIILQNSAVQSLELPAEHNLTYIALNGAKSHYDFDAIIESVYQTAVEENIVGGFLQFTNYGTLSPSSLEKAESLRTDYGWNVIL
jgi:hypothetical protein